MQKHIKENGNIIYGDLSKQTNFNCKFMGHNNIVYIAEQTDQVSIEFRGNNSVVFIGKNLKSVNGINIILYTNNLIYIGDNSSFGITTFWVSESKNIIIGNNCMFSWHLFFRTSDQHIILDRDSNNRINYSKSIYIGDHVWGGINTQYNKGTKIFSGSVLGMNSIATRDYFSNSINAGIPAKQLKENIFWSDVYPKDNSILNMKYDLYCNDDFKFTYNKAEFLSPKAIEEKLDSLETAHEKLEFVYDAIYCNKNKNRFAYFKDKPYDLPLPKYESKFKLLKFEEIQPTPPKPATPQPTPQELEIKALQEKIKELETNHQKALKLKNHLSYKLGQALIKANKTWYKGGYVKFIFEAIRIKKEHKNRKQN